MNESKSDVTKAVYQKYPGLRESIVSNILLPYCKQGFYQNMQCMTTSLLGFRTHPGNICWCALIFHWAIYLKNHYLKCSCVSHPCESHEVHDLACLLATSGCLLSHMPMLCKSRSKHQEPVNYSSGLLICCRHVQHQDLFLLKSQKLPRQIFVAIKMANGTFLLSRYTVFKEES